MAVDLTIRSLELHEIRLCEVVQDNVWGMPDGRDIVPLHLLRSAQKNGGVLLGAFDGTDLLGFVFGYVGMTPEGKVKHCSHMMGVAPECQGQGIGYQLKLAQRRQVLAQGLNLVTWTYDPLESRNAYLNVQKLGAVCQTYMRDFYGTMTDGLNQGLPTDRLQVDWWIDSAHVQNRIQEADDLPAQDAVDWVCTAEQRSDGLLMPGEPVLDASANWLMFEIPAGFRAIKNVDVDLALRWRHVSRAVFERYFEAGYRVVGFKTFFEGIVVVATIYCTTQGREYRA